MSPRANIFCLLAVCVLVVISVFVYTINWSWSSTDPSDANSTVSRATPTLQFVIIVTRHGNRGTLYTLPTLYAREDRAAWPYGGAQLTHHGRVQMYDLGRKIRSLYNGFLNETYYQEDFKASSTVVDRTLASAELFLAGLFPPKGFQVWKKELAWQPIPIFPCYLVDSRYSDRDKSLMLCRRFYEDQKKSLATFEEKNKSNLTQLYKYLASQIGPSSYSLVLDHIWDPLFCADEEGLPLPNWSAAVYPEPIRSLRYQEFEASLVATDTMIRLSHGLLFKEMVDLMQAKVEGSLSPDRRMYYYSTHDTTLIGLRGILGLAGSGLGIVNAGSAFTFEIHKNPQTNNFYIQVLYIDGGSSDLEPKMINIPDCGDPCQLNHLLSITEKYYNIEDHDKECQTDGVPSEAL